MMNCLFRGAALVGATLVAVSVHAGEPAQETLLWLGPWETQAAPSAKEGPLPEPADCLAHTLKMGQANTSWHGATISEMSVWDYPLFKPFLDMFASRTMRSYRAYGLNGGLMNFNVADGYGKPNPNDNQPIQGYGGLEVLDHRPLWANGYYDVLQRNNHDFVGFIGGADGVHTDRTHAYLRGEEVRKEAVFIWDGADEVDVRAEWRYTIQTVGLPFVTTAATGSFGAASSVATSDGKGQSEINYYLCEFESDVAEPTEGALHLVIGMPMQMWLNGQVIAKYDRPFETFAYGRSCKTTVKVKILPGRNRIGIKTFCREPLKSNAFAVWLRESADAEVKAAETGPSLYERHYKKFDPYMYVYW